MTCRHGPGDPNCSSYRPVATPVGTPTTPDAEKYTVECVEPVGPHMVMMVKYPNCSRCSYEGNKVMVWLNVSLLDVVKWRKIDPHFVDPKTSRPPTEAPGPAARFPASDVGWCDALNYARSKDRPLPR